MVGGGIGGMAAAWFLADQARVTLLEADDRLGGKILTSHFRDGPVDEGADAFLARVPAAVDLCHSLGLAGELTTPATSRAFVWTGGRLRAIPTGTVLGVPRRLTPLARSHLLSPAGLARVAIEPLLPRRVGRRSSPAGPRDESVGDLVSARFGRQLHRRLVDPLLGGINAGRSEELSLDVAAPRLAAVARRHRSLLVGLRRDVPDAPAGPGAPVFHSLIGGMGRLVDRLGEAVAASGVDIRTSAGADSIEPSSRPSGGYVVHTAAGPAVAGDAVVLALPAFAAAGLLRALSPATSQTLDRVDYASVALVTLAYPPDSVARTLDGSGFLVPRADGTVVTACTWMSAKWAALARPDATILRASVGRWGDESALAFDDDELVERVHAELDQAIGLRGRPLAVRVSRWPRALPQYRPGHLDRMATVEAVLAEDAPGVALAGAACRGVGIPTCIASGRAAADRILASLAARP